MDNRQDSDVSMDIWHRCWGVKENPDPSSAAWASIRQWMGQEFDRPMDAIETSVVAEVGE